MGGSKIRGKTPRGQLARIYFANAALRSGPAAIAAGLAMLAAAMLWPFVPTVSAMALVALGATWSTMAQFRRRPAALPIAMAHIAVYGALYAIFVGAALHAAGPAGAAARLVTVADIAFSIGPFAIAAQHVWCEVCAG